MAALAVRTDEDLELHADLVRGRVGVRIRVSGTDGDLDSWQTFGAPHGTLTYGTPEAGTRTAYIQ